MVVLLTIAAFTVAAEIGHVVSSPGWLDLSIVKRLVFDKLIYFVPLGYYLLA